MAIFSLNKVKIEQIKNVENNNFASWPESATYGYFGGGSPPITNLISRLDFSNETVSNPGKNLPTTRRAAATGSNNSYGYFAGGSNPATTCTITRLDFSNETVSNPGNNLPSIRTRMAATTSNFYGYFFGGGYTNPPQTFYCTITRLDFSNETVSDIGDLPSPRSHFAAISNSN